MHKNFLEIYSINYTVEKEKLLLDTFYTVFQPLQNLMFYSLVLKYNGIIKHKNKNNNQIAKNMFYSLLFIIVKYYNSIILYI